MGPFHHFSSLILISLGPYVNYGYFSEWVHVRFTDLIQQFATDSNECYNKLGDMGSQDMAHSCGEALGLEQEVIKRSEYMGHCYQMTRSTRVGAGENIMLEHTEHGSCMWRSTAVKAGDAK